MLTFWERFEARKRDISVLCAVTGQRLNSTGLTLLYLVMSICEFEPVEHYLDSALAFLKKYQWIYNFKNTDILTNRIFSKFPSAWMSYFDTLSVEALHNLITGNISDCPIIDLKILIGEINFLNPKNQYSTLETRTYSCTNSCISRKKSHEITLMAPVVSEVCQENVCDLIIDIGSGVGHLAYVLNEEYGYRVLSLEVSKKLIDTALRNQEKLHPKSRGLVVFEQMLVTDFSGNDIQKLVEQHFGCDQKICFTSLHGCADLSVDVLKLFINCKYASSLVIMPCCYHRMAVEREDSDLHYFKNIPLSVTSKELFGKYDAYTFITQPFLRLACQQTVGAFIRMSRVEHQKHAEKCMHRAILQVVAESENCSVRRLKRKSGKSDARDSDGGFQAYLNNLGNTHELIRPDDQKHNITDEAFTSKMHEKWSEYKNYCWRVEVLMGLQAAIQSICENVILLDRVEFLKEKGVHCYKRKITNDSISPRCWALIAKKNAE